MFEYELISDDSIAFVGRLDASQIEKASKALEGLSGNEVVVDLSRLDYISSAGLGVLLIAQKRAVASGKSLVLSKPKPPIMNVLKISGFDKVFTVRH